MRLFDPGVSGAGMEGVAEEAGGGFAAALASVYAAVGGVEELAKARLGVRVTLAAIAAEVRRRRSAGETGEAGSTVWRFRAERSSSIAKRDERGLLNCGVVS